VTQAKAMNALYDKLWLYYNLLQPATRLQEKRLVQREQGGFPARGVHGQVQTPFDRLCATEAMAAPIRPLAGPMFHT